MAHRQRWSFRAQSTVGNRYMVAASICAKYMRVCWMLYVLFASLIYPFGAAKLTPSFSATLLKSHCQGTQHDTTPGHSILTTGKPMIVQPCMVECWVPSRDQQFPMLRTLLCPGLGTEPTTFLTWRNALHYNQTWGRAKRGVTSVKAEKGNTYDMIGKKGPTYRHGGVIHMVSPWYVLLVPRESPGRAGIPL